MSASSTTWLPLSFLFNILVVFITYEAFSVLGGFLCDSLVARPGGGYFVSCHLVLFSVVLSLTQIKFGKSVTFFKTLFKREKFCGRVREG